MAFYDKLFRFAMLGTLFVASELGDVLIADHQDGRLLRHARSDLTTYAGRKVRCFAPR